MTGVQEQQEQFLAQYAKEAQKVTLSVKRWNFNTNVCELKIVRDTDVIQIDSKLPMIVLSEFNTNLAPSSGLGPVTLFECFKLRQHSVHQWLSEHDFLLECLEIRLPTVTLALRSTGFRIPKGVKIPSFMEGSWSALLRRGSKEESQFLAIGRPVSHRIPYGAWVHT